MSRTFGRAFRRMLVIRAAAAFAERQENPALRKLE